MTKIEWRFMRPEDETAVKALHAKLEQRVGRKLDLPNLLSEPVLVCIVGETNGVVTHGIFLEAEAEVCVIGNNVLAPEQTRDAEAYLLSVLDRFKIRIVRAFVPAEMVKDFTSKSGLYRRMLIFMGFVKPEVRKAPALRRVLDGMGFTPEDSSIVSHFFRWVRAADGCPAEVETKATGAAKS